MGWERVELRITGHVSRHNSDQDVDDDADWDELTDRIRQITREHRYEKLELDIW